MKFAFFILATTVIAITTTGPLAADEILPAESELPDQPSSEPANETAIETVSEPGDSQVSIAIRRAAASEHLARLNDEQRYDEAAGVALQVLRLTQEEYGEDAPQVIDPLLDLAKAQRKDADLSTAELNMTTAIALIEKYQGRLSAELIAPMTTLGEIYNKSGQYDNAAQSFSKALRLNHVNQGFTNFDQFPIMDGLTSSYASQNDMEEATFFQKSQLEIQQRRLGIDNPETAAAYYKLGRWYNSIYLFDEAMLTYQRADRVVRNALGKDSPKRVEGLQGLALVYHRLGNRSQANSTLRKALQLIEDSPDGDPFQRASILISLGDGLTREGKFTTAGDQYTAAWQVLPDDEAGDRRRELYFDQSVRLEGNLYPRPARRARGQPADELETGSILINYSIDTRGRVTNASIIESDPPGLMDRSFMSIYRQSLYRPHYVEGVAQPSNGRLAKHEFFYIGDETTIKDEADTDVKEDQERGKLSYPGKD